MSEKKYGRTFLTAEWRYLAMLNYVVPPELLEPHVPAGTELDAFNGKHYVSLVGFRFTHTRLLGIPIPFHRHFDEINLRFYVRRMHGDEVRRGVVFIKEIVPRRAIAFAANTLYGEHYAAHRMTHRIDTETGHVEYGWQDKDRSNSFALTMQGEPALPESDSEEEFITEHYWGYTQRTSRRTTEYRVEHPQWRVWNAAVDTFEVDVSGTYGPEWSQHLNAQPDSAFIADGSAITVRTPRTLAA